MLVIFMLVGVAFHGQLSVWHWKYILAVVGLIFSYVSATSFNDLADEEIDKINHKGKKGRLLVTKEATRIELARLGIGASLGMLLCGLLINKWALAVMALGLFVNINYSLRPLIISYRTFVAPLFLTIGYVIVPYLLGLSVLNYAPTHLDWLLLSAITLLFLARINLKDFRDREGDSRYGKPTLLLKYGKKVTVLVSLIALSAGIVLLLRLFTGNIGEQVLIVVGWLVISLLFVLLWRSPIGTKEQLLIALSAMVGNGLLFTVLAAFTLTHMLIPKSTAVIVEVFFMVLALANLHFLKRDPDVVLGTYRG